MIYDTNTEMFQRFLKLKMDKKSQNQKNIQSQPKTRGMKQRGADLNDVAAQSA